MLHLKTGSVRSRKESVRTRLRSHLVFTVVMDLVRPVGSEVLRFCLFLLFQTVSEESRNLMSSSS